MEQGTANEEFCVPWRATPTTAASSTAGKSPPLLLPTPDAASFSTAPELGRLQHLVARLAPQAASKREFNALAEKEENAAPSFTSFESVRACSCSQPAQPTNKGGPTKSREAVVGTPTAFWVLSIGNFVIH